MVEFADSGGNSAAERLTILLMFAGGWLLPRRARASE
jgi:hypothetical protein